MTDEQRVQIINLREAGNGYKKIGQLLGLSENTVKSFCQRRNLGGVVVQTAAGVSVCKCCGKARHDGILDNFLAQTSCNQYYCGENELVSK